MFRSSYLDHGFLLAAARSRVAVDHGDRVAVAVVGRTAICPLLQKDSMEMRGSDTRTTLSQDSGSLQ